MSTEFHFPSILPKVYSRRGVLHATEGKCLSYLSNLEGRIFGMATACLRRRGVCLWMNGKMCNYLKLQRKRVLLRRVPPAEAVRRLS